MLNNFPPLKRPKHDAHISGNCLYCDQQEQQDGSCSHQSTTSQLALEYQNLRAATEDPTIDMEDIERRLRKLETRLTSRLPDDVSPFEQQQQRSVHEVFYTSTFNVNNSTTPDPTQQESIITLTSAGIDITTDIIEPHHFMKLLLNGINTTFVQQKAAETYNRRTNLIGPDMDNPNNQQGISNLTIDKEDPEELLWLDMVLTTRYPMCFLVYQMVEKDRLVEWVSHPYIDGLQGQVKLEHSLLAKAVRAFVYNHEKIAARHDHGDSDLLNDPAGDDPSYRNINLNRGAFYFQQAEELLELCYMNSSRNNIRSLLHMYMYQVMTPGGHLKSIHYSDLAIRMAQVLKLNNEKGMLVNEQLREDDRRLWWSTVWAHLWACVSFNRPFLVDASDIILPNGRPPSKRQDESSQVGYCIDFCVNSVKLILLCRSIRQRLKVKTTEAKLLWTLQDIEHQLEAWSLALPEALQLRFLTNGTNINTHHDHMDDVGQHEHGNERSSQVFGIEIALLLQGQWATAKMRVYECFSTNDGSILDLLVVRNRLQVAMEFTNYLHQAAERVRPCFLMYLLTETQPSLATLLTLVAYEHNTDIIQQAAIRQLSTLKLLFRRHPFSDNSTCHQWIQRIDQTLQEYAPPPPPPSPLPGTTDQTVMETNWSTSLPVADHPILNESTHMPSNAYTYQHEDNHLQQYMHYQYAQPQQYPQQQYQPYLHQPIINEGTSHHPMRSMNFDLLSSTPPALMQPKRPNEWMARKASMLNGVGFYAIDSDTNGPLVNSSYENDTHHHQYLSPDQYLHEQDIRPSTTSLSMDYHLKPVALPSDTGSSVRNRTPNQPPPSKEPSISIPPATSALSHLARDYQRQHGERRSEKAAGKQPSYIYPDSTTLDPNHQHPFLPHPSTDSPGRHF